MAVTWKKLAYVDDIAPSSGNLLKTGGFPSWTVGVDGATHFPDGWVAEGTPTNIKQETADVGHGKYAVRITTDAVNEGQKQTLSGLKASTQYTIQVRAKATAADTARLFTTGATSDVDDESTSTSWVGLEGTFTTDGSGTNVVVKLVGKASGDIVWFCGIICTEGAVTPIFAPHPNDEHLKAIDWQDATPANFDYGLLRMECGVARAVFVDGNTLAIAVTYGTAFTKILAVSFNFNMGSQQGLAWGQVDSQPIQNYSSNIFTLRLRDEGGGFLVTDYIDCPWIAIGVV